MATSPNDAPQKTPSALSPAQARRAEAQFQAACALHDQGLLDAATAAYAACLQIDPQHVAAHTNLGNVWRQQGNADTALAHFDQAIAMAPNYALAHYNRASLLQAHGLPEAALASYSDCVALQPDFAEAWCNSGVLLLEWHQYAPAIECLQRAIALRPAFAEALNSLGSAYLELQRWDDALGCLEAAIQAQPDLADAFINVGLVLENTRHGEAAHVAFRQALALAPHSGKALCNAYRAALGLCHWQHRTDDERTLLQAVAEGRSDIDPFTLLAVHGAACAPGMLLRPAALRYAEQRYPELAQPPLIAPGPRAAADPALPPDKADPRPLRIGYLSADFHDHATLHLLRGVLQHHDASGFTIYGYSYGATHDAVTDQAAAACAVFRDLRSVSVADAARQIAADGVDILVDLKGYTGHSRLGITALRPAPVIVNWLGYPGTLGHPRLADYVIGDPVVTPPAHAAHYSETLALMPHCYQPNDRQRRVGPRPTRASQGLPDDGLVFCCFNQSYKWDADTFTMACDLLAAVPGSVLWMLQPPQGAAPALRARMAARGVDPTRLVFAAWAPPAEHLARLACADLALDTFPYTSHTTASDALWAGVPLVTRQGESFVSRVAASLLTTLGLPQLIANDLPDALERALQLARNPSALATVRQQLADQRLRSPLFDTARFTRDLERLYRAMWAQHQQGIRATIALDPLDRLDPLTPPAGLD